MDQDYQSDAVPCGRCPCCLKRRSSQWVFRLQQENKICSASAFITLTYDDDHIPTTPSGLPTLRSKDYQDFMKRLRKDSNIKYKYYACGEYGSITQRPHFHTIMFFQDPEIRKPVKQIPEEIRIQESWGKGQVDIGQVTGASIAYVAGYLEKRLYTDPSLYGDRQKEKSLMSKGMGINYLTPKVYGYYKKKLHPYLTVEGGQKISLPRYYKEKIFTKDEQKILADKAKLYIEENNPFPSDKSAFEWKKELLRKRERNNQLKRITI